MAVVMVVCTVHVAPLFNFAVGLCVERAEGHSLSLTHPHRLAACLSVPRLCVLHCIDVAVVFCLSPSSFLGACAGVRPRVSVSLCVCQCFRVVWALRLVMLLFEGNTVHSPRFLYCPFIPQFVSCAR